MEDKKLPEALEEIPAASKSPIGGRGRILLVGFVLLIGIAYLVYAAFPGSTSYYFTVDEMAAFEGPVEGKSFRVKGKLVTESFRREEKGTLAYFTLYANDDQLKATYDGVVPDLFFDDHSEIILQGAYGDGGVFDADTVSVLCPTKYESLEEKTAQRPTY